jgi:hypothetical protein
MADEIRNDTRGPGPSAGEWTGQSDLARRYDQLIAAAGGDAPFREFWKMGKRLFQAGPAESLCSDRGGARGHHALGRP